MLDSAYQLEKIREECRACGHADGCQNEWSSCDSCETYKKWEEYLEELKEFLD